MAAEPPAPAPQPGPSLITPLRKINFSTHAPLRQVTTTLRRVWLLDPPLTHAELADPSTVQECFRALCETIGTDIITANANAAAKWDHARWLQHTPLKLLDPPVTAAATGLASVVSPWRDDMYDMYRHVFSDLFGALVAAASTPADERALLACYDPAKADAVALVVLPAPAAEGGGRVDTTTTTAFATDTFLYPVWVHPQATVAFAAEGAEEGGHVWAAGDEASWTTGLWVRAGRDVALTTAMAEDGGEDKTGVAAVFVTGHCEAKGGEASGETTAAEGDTTAPAEAATGS